MDKSVKLSQRQYLKRAKLNGYKSINELSADFLPGLNIIIGKNGTGKTNFLNFLKFALDQDYSELFRAQTQLTYSDDVDEVKLIANKEFLLPNKLDRPDSILANLNKHAVEFEILKGEKVIKITGNEANGLEKYISEYNLYFSVTKISHGIPDLLPLVKTPVQFHINFNGSIEDIMPKDKKSTPSFVYGLLFSVYFEFFRDETLRDQSAEQIKERIKNCLNAIDIITEYFIKYSVIKDIRLVEGINVFIDLTKEQITVNNLLFEFNIEGTWYPYENLSDGTKRIFYIIAEVAFLEYGGLPLYLFKDEAKSFSDQEKTFSLQTIALIEEPELGIHPHQLHKLMLFLKEKALETQIIITTHSPQVLDILEKDELDRIVIAELDTKEGTKLKHLTSKQIKKAQDYMSEGFLSDYWRYSDLEAR